MARNIKDIEREIERTRLQLASTLDEIALRTKPARLIDDAKTQTTVFLQDPKVQKVLLGVSLAVAGVVALTVARGRRRKKDIKELQRILLQDA